MLDRLLEGRLQFLKFIQNRVGTREAAEDILQAAFVKGLEKGAAFATKSPPLPGSIEFCGTPLSITIGSGEPPIEGLRL